MFIVRARYLTVHENCPIFNLYIGQQWQVCNVGLVDVGSGISGEGSRIIGVRSGIRITVVGSGWDLVSHPQLEG